MYGKIFYSSCLWDFLVLSSIYTTGHWLLEKSGYRFDPLCQYQYMYSLVYYIDKVL